MSSIDDYKKMVKKSCKNSMESKVKEHLVKNCPNFDPNKFNDCMAYLFDTARKILDGKNGEIPDEVCYKICRDYFNDGPSKNDAEEVETVKEASKQTEQVEGQLDMFAAMGMA